MHWKAIIFDLDGVIVDSEPLHMAAFNQLLQRHGIPYRFEEEEYGRSFVGIPVSQNTAWHPPRFPWKKPVAELQKERETIYEELISIPHNLQAYPGLIPLLQKLKEKGIAAAIASGSPHHHVDKVLQGLSITDYFSVVVGGNDVPRKKPAPDVYCKAVELLGLAPEDCLALEDSTTGVQSAKAAGLQVFAIANRFTRHQDLTAADRSFPSLDMLRDRLLI